VTGGVRATIARNLATDPNLIEGILDGALDRARKLRNGLFGKVRRRIILDKAAHTAFLAEGLAKISSVSIEIDLSQSLERLFRFE